MGWAEQEFETIDQGDEHLNRRAVLLAERLEQKPEPAFSGHARTGPRQQRFNCSCATNRSAVKGQGKTTTTAGFDYGEWRFPDNTKVSLIGVPGQDRFEAMWDIMLPRSSAIVLWLYGDRDARLMECSKWLTALAKRKSIARLAVAVTRLPEGTQEDALNPSRELVSQYHPLAPIITADPRNPSDVLQAITMALTTPYAALDRL